MKKSLMFILVLSVIFACLYTKLNNDSHVIPTKPTTERKVIATTVPVTDVTYDFSGKVVTLPEKLKAEADKISAKYNAVGIQIAVMKNNELAYTYEYGYSDLYNKTPVNSDNKFRVASLAKFVTDAVFMKLCDQGKVSIDADISDYLGFTARNPYYPDVIVTPAMLMSHSGTVVDSDAFTRSLYNNSSYTIQEVLNSPGTFCQAEPGKFYYYSNISVAVIGAICELVTNRPFYELAKEFFFDPLEIDASYLACELENKDLIANIYGNGGLSVSDQLYARFHPTIGQTHHIVQGNLIVSAKDYMKFVAMISAGGVTEKGERLLSEKSVEEMLKSRIYAEGLGSGFGTEENKNIFVNRTLYSHTGNSYGLYSIYAFDPITGDGITILTSGANVNYLDDIGIYDICYDYVKLLFPGQ